MQESRNNATNKIITAMYAKREFTDRVNIYVLQLATGVYCKFLPHNTGPFCIFSVQLNTVTIDKHGIENTFIIDCVVHTLAMSRTPPTSRTPLSNNQKTKVQTNNYKKRTPTAMPIKNM